MDSVEGKVAFITGGTGGIGLAIVKKLIQSGTKGVAVVDLSEEVGLKVIEEIIDTFGKNKAIFIKADITDKQQLQDAFQQTVKIYKQLDIVVNNAGIVNEIEWEKTIAVNLIAVIEGTYLAMKNYLPKYRSGEEGVIINIGSVLGLETIQVTPMYCATKHGLIGFGKAIGGEAFYKEYKVRILTICPGLVETPMTQTKQKIFFEEIKENEIQSVNSIAQSPEHVADALIDIIKVGRNGSLWVTEDNEPVYEVVIPHRKTMKV